MRGAARVDVHELAFRIEGHTAPVRAAAGEGIHDRALRARRRVEAFGARAGDLFAAGLAVPVGEAPGVVRRQRLRHQRRRRDGERLRRRQELARRRALRHGALLHFEDRLARVAVEHEDEAGLRHLHHGIKRLAAPRQRDEARLCGKIVIPDIVMHGLEMPAHRSRRRVERDDGIRVAAVAGALAAEEIGAGRGGRQEEKPARPVRRHRRPDIGVARMLRDAARPVFWMVLRAARHRIELPERFARARIEGADGALGRIDAAIVADGGADDDDAMRDGGRRRDLEFARPDEIHAGVDANLPIRAETETGLAGRCIERDEAAVDRAHEKPRGAEIVLARRRIRPGRDAPADELVPRPVTGRNLRIVAPLLGTRARIERDHLVEGRAEDKRARDENRRALEGAVLHVVRMDRHVARGERPCRCEIADILRRDLRRCGMALPAGVAAIMGPTFRRRGEWQQQSQRQTEPKTDHLFISLKFID